MYTNTKEKKVYRVILDKIRVLLRDGGSVDVYYYDDTRSFLYHPNPDQLYAEVYNCLDSKETYEYK